MHEIENAVQLLPAVQEVLELPPALGGQVVELPEAAVVLHTVGAEGAPLLQAAEDGIEGGLREGDAAAEVLDDLVAVGIPPAERRQDAVIQQSALELRVQHGGTSFAL